MNTARVIHIIAEDLDTAAERLEAVEFDLLDHKDDVANSFSGTLTGYDQILTHLAEKMRSIANDIESGEAGAPRSTALATEMAVDFRVPALADELREAHARIRELETSAC